VLLPDRTFFSDICVRAKKTRTATGLWDLEIREDELIASPSLTTGKYMHVRQVF
jgi:hypothetical protein